MVWCVLPGVFVGDIEWSFVSFEVYLIDTDEKQYYTD
jgi:hypothetical protein